MRLRQSLLAEIFGWTDEEPETAGLKGVEALREEATP